MSSERLIPRLLARRDRLGRVEKDAILASVLEGVTPRRRQTRWWLGLVPAVAVTIAVVLFGPWRSHAPSSESSEFASRGGGAPVASFHTSCPVPCKQGRKVLFDLYGTTGYRYFAAFSKHSDGLVLWYFPASPEDVSIDLVTQPKDGVLDQGILLGDEHIEGTYRIYGVFSRVPLTRDAIRAGFDEAHLSVGPATTVIATEIVVE